MQGQDAIEYNCKQLGFSSDHPVTEGAKEYYRRIAQSMVSMSLFRECDRYMHIIAIDSACRSQQNSTKRKELKALSQAPLEKYLECLNVVKKILKLNYTSDLSIRDLDMMFGGNLLENRANELLDRFKRSARPEHYAQNETSFIVSAFLEAAARQKISSDRLTREVLDYAEVPMASYKKAKIYFTTVLSDTNTSKGNISSNGAGSGKPQRVSVQDVPKQSSLSRINERNSIVAAPLNAYDSIREQINSINRMQDAADSGAAVDAHHYLDASYLNEGSTDATGMPRMSSKRALTMAGGMEHYRDNIRAGVEENEQQKKRKVQRRALYDAWKACILFSD